MKWRWYLIGLVILVALAVAPLARAILWPPVGTSGSTPNNFNPLCSTTAPFSLTNLNGSMQGALNPRAYCASGSSLTTTTTGTIAAGATALNVTNATSFLMNEQVRVYGAGDASNIPVTPAAPTITQFGTAGSTTYGYKCLPFNASYGFTGVSAEGTTATGNATLSGSNANQVHCPITTNAALYAFWRTTGGGGPALIGVTSGGTVVDQGQTGPRTYDSFPFFAATPPTSGENNWLIATILGVSSNIVTLDTPVTTAISAAVGTFNVEHEDGTAIRAAFATQQTKTDDTYGTQIFFPPGFYNYCAAPMDGAYVNIAGNMKGGSVPIAQPLNTGGTTIHICPGQYLFLPSGAVSAARVHGLTIDGGYGTFHQTLIGSNVSSGYFIFDDNRLLDYTRAAIATDVVNGNIPFLTVTDNEITALDDHASMGVVWSGSSMDVLRHNESVRNTWDVKENLAGQQDSMEQNNFQMSGPPESATQLRGYLWLVPKSNLPNGQSFTSDHDRYSVEAEAQGDQKVLIADQTSTSNDQTVQFPAVSQANDVTATSGSTTLTSPSNPWALTDVGKGIYCRMCATGGRDLYTVIASFTSAGQIDMTRAATATPSALTTARWFTPSIGLTWDLLFAHDLFIGGGTIGTPGPNPVLFAATANLFGSTFLSDYFDDVASVVATYGCMTGAGALQRPTYDTLLINPRSAGLGTFSAQPSAIGSNCYSRNIGANGKWDHFNTPNDDTNGYYISGGSANQNNTAINSAVLVGTATKVGAVTDPDGEQDAAEFNFAASTDQISSKNIPAAGFTANEPLWLTFYLRQGTSTPLHQIMVLFAYADNSINWAARIVEIPPAGQNWYPIVVPFSVSSNVLPFHWVFQPAVVADTGNVQIAEVTVQRGARPAQKTSIQGQGNYYTNLGPMRSVVTVSSCGTGSPVPVPNSTNNAGEVTIGGGATACTINFTAPVFKAPPICEVIDRTSRAIPTYSTTASTIAISANVAAADVVDWHCWGVEPTPTPTPTPTQTPTPTPT